MGATNTRDHPSRAPQRLAVTLHPLPLRATGMLACPESPTWLQLKGRKREAEATAVQLWGPDGEEQLGGARAPACLPASLACPPNDRLYCPPPPALLG